MKIITCILILAAFESIKATFASQRSKSVEAETGLTYHFISFLNESGYEFYGFNRSDLLGGSYGGKLNDDDQITRQPVIFVHGNGDLAAGDDARNQAGFVHTIEYFLSQGYKQSELYATTWGFADIPHESQHYHSREYMVYIRKFIDAVLEYTNATKVDVISHSMGVTFARRVLKGGVVKSVGYPFDLGPPLTEFVDTFIGIAGPNWGISHCIMDFYDEYKSCSKQSGFYPGFQSNGNGSMPQNLSSFLAEMNLDQTREAQHSYAILSLYDAVVTPYVYDRYTSEFPTQDGSYMFESEEYTHVGVKDKSVEMQYNLVTTHKFVNSSSGKTKLDLFRTAFDKQSIQEQ
ncbi:lipase [Stylonychia lemnae]|uniref:Lipase n=1 Tax=Stylonychia lemnae TaxID=5949 RepID=A0A077ZPW0_STYLE|nr:lipase [Stylonychia lemnae]|eukprot:CDW71933.1 lipase [Stylonychia lemnae]